MGEWKRKAIECLPELETEFNQEHLSIYSVFFELLPATREAHRDNDAEKLKNTMLLQSGASGRKIRNYGMLQQ